MFVPQLCARFKPTREYNLLQMYTDLGACTTTLLFVNKKHSS